MRNKIKLLSFFIVIIILQQSEGFSEDLCWKNKELIDCNPYNPECPSGVTTRDCSFSALHGYVSGKDAANFSRSSIHVDATYYMLTAMGFSPDFAFWVVAYSEAADKGEYKHWDKCGNPMGGKYDTASIKGFNRGFFCGGGFDYHFTVDPELSKTEPLKRHLGQIHNWSFRQSDMLCTSGFTEPYGSAPHSLDDYFSGSSCYCNGANQDSCPGLILATRALNLLYEKWVPFPGWTGKQIVDFPENISELCELDKFSPVTYIDTFDKHIANNSTGRLNNGDVPDSAARLAILIHSIGDSLSHDLCNNAMSWTVDTSTGIINVARVDTINCDQDMHALYHYFEVGHNVSYYTTDDHIYYVYRALSEFKQQFNASNPTWFNSSITPITYNQLYNDVVNGIFSLDGTAPFKVASNRVQSFVSLLEARNLPPLPGYGPDYKC